MRGEILTEAEQRQAFEFWRETEHLAPEVLEDIGYDMGPLRAFLLDLYWKGSER